MGFYKELGDRLEQWLKEKIKVVDTKVESIAKYQRYVNTDLDYGLVTILGDVTNVTLNMVIPFDTIRNTNNINFDIANNSFHLKANKTYKIESLVRYCSVESFIYYGIYDVTNDKWIQDVTGITETTNNGWDASTPTCTIITTTEDVDIQIKITEIGAITTGLIHSATSYFEVQEINRQITIDPVEHVNESHGIEDTPVGHIISHMGTVAPKHYLICDGTEYNIEDYPYLAQHIEDNFGSINFFGGDGEITFAVPDLRGEFLRGTGTNSHANQGNGANVGTHQDATQHLYFCLSQETSMHSFSFQPRTGYEDWDGAKLKADTMLGNGTANRWIYSDGGNTSNEYSHYTSRPTNTSVLYCIKYEPTYFMNTYNTNYMQPSLYSEEERVVGCWIDGKPLYEKTIEMTVPTTSSEGVQAVNTQELSDLNIAYVVSFNGYMTNGVTCNPVPNINASMTSGVTMWYNIEEKKLYIANLCVSWNDRTLYVTIQYTKTTDEENSFTESMLKESYIKLDSTCTDEELQQAISDMVKEINADPVIEPEQSIADIPMTIPELYEEDTPTIIPEIIPDEESEQVVEPEEVTPEVTDEPETEVTEVTEGGTNNESE